MNDPGFSPVYRLLYLSAAKREMKTEDLHAILSTARDRNADAGITGLLLYVERQFLQYLEGEQKAVEALFERIEADPRHSGVMRLLSGTCGQRVFSDWSMGYQPLEADERDCVCGLIDLCKHSMRDRLPTDAPEEIVTLIESFYKNSLGLRDYD